MQVATRLLNVRLQTWEQNDASPVNSASFYASNLGRETTQSVFSLHLNDGDHERATEALFAFIAQIQQHGFSKQEVDSELARLLKINERAVDRQQNSLDLAGDLMVSAASDQLLVSDDVKYELNKRFLKEMTTASVNLAFQSMIEPKSRLALATYTQREHAKYLSANEVSTVWEHAMTVTQPAWIPDQDAATLPIHEYTSGTLKKEKAWAKHKLVEYRLSNGSKLVYRYSDNNPGQVHFKALTQGGLRSVPADQYHMLRMATSLVDETGIGGVPQQDIQTIFRGNPVVMSTIMDDYQQGYSGWSKTENFEKMLRLFRLKLGDAPVSEKSTE